MNSAHHRATRSGVSASPSRSGSSPIALRISTTASSIRYLSTAIVPLRLPPRAVAPAISADVIVIEDAEAPDGPAATAAEEARPDGPDDPPATPSDLGVGDVEPPGDEVQVVGILPAATLQPGRSLLAFGILRRSDLAHPD